MWLNDLYKMFVSKDNFETILDICIEDIYNKTGKKIDHNNNDKMFFEIANKISSQVFSVESKNPILKKQTPEQSLHIINGIVIDELVNYILSKKQNILKEPEILKESEIVKEKGAWIVNPSFEHKKIEDTLKISIEKSETKYISPIENIISINILSLHMYTQDYLVTELNNTLVINNNNEKITIKINPGNYTKDKLFAELGSSILKKTNKYVDFYIQKNDNKVYLSSDIDISYTDSTINNILGICTGNPIKLIKRNKLQFGIKFSFENEINNFEYSNPLIINNNKKDNYTGPILKEFKLNYHKKFNRPVNLEEIKIDFDNYNHRGYPYYLIIEITKMS